MAEVEERTLENAPRVVGRSLDSKLHLIFSHNKHHGTQLSHRYHQGLFHLGKQYKCAEGLFLQVINPTAGLFSDDRFESLFDVQENAHATISSPSATQIFQMEEDGIAIGKQKVLVGKNATLDWSPNSIVPHKNSRLKLSTEIYLSENSTLFYTDMISPGRIAHGECLRFSQLSSSLAVYNQSRIAVKENFKILTDHDKLRWRMIQSERIPYYATLWIASDIVKSIPFQHHQNNKNEPIDVGYTQIEPNLSVVRLASPSQATIKREISNIKRQFIETLKLNPTRI